MTRDELNNEYFDWMCQLVSNNKRYSKRTSYMKLLAYLHSREFTYTIPMDGNRAADGIDLRYRFGDLSGYSDPMIAAYLDDKPCSILEMMIALSIRCEEHIMEDSEVGDRTGQWFWNMIVSLGLGPMTDERFDEDRADEIIERFLNREYARDGHGGLFIVPGPRDLRSVEIWYQMCWYLNTIL